MTDLHRATLRCMQLVLTLLLSIGFEDADRDLLVLTEPGPQNGILFLLNFWSSCKKHLPGVAIQCSSM